jgi:[ribosomal protein S5]-alanine N-acetyltransferase
VVLLRQWRAADADWYADTIRDPVIQRYTSEPPILTADQVGAAIADLADQADAVGFVICDATTGQRLGNIALRHDGKTGAVGYWVAASARGRGVATRALRLCPFRGVRELRFQAAAGTAGSGSHGLPVRAAVTASRAVRPCAAAESR